MNIKSTHFTPHLLLVLSQVLIASSFPATAMLDLNNSVISLNILRFVIAVVCLAPFVLFKPKYRKQLKQTWLKGMIIGGFYSAYFQFLFISLKQTTPLHTGTLYTLTPFLTAVLSFVVWRYRINRYELLAYAIGSIGTAWVVFKGKIDLILGFHLNPGDWIYLGAVVCMSLYILSMKILHKGEDAIVMTFSSLLGGLIVTSLAAFFMGVELGWLRLSTHDFTVLFYIAVATSLMTSYLTQKASQKLLSIEVTTYIYLSPVLVAIEVAILGGQLPELKVLPGILLSVFATVVLLYFAQIKKRELSRASSK
ncbi:DMT family transporter [Parashewanella curva]|uniref:DMT family transporter n=1 Tax=Parashewanella curva TaxID=2338552 RepID=A0A3L8PZX5_9GAMM|nr:DMT family transporter [Parashewanella curva]RLV59652.1 DMT family transporter [Parashewanella curva]